MAVTRLAGVDGCPGGWIAVVRDRPGGTATAALLPDAAGLFALAESCEVLALDLPMGLPASGARACDVEARRRLGRPRASSVFAAPIRPALAARDHAEASQITERVDGKRVSVQAWNLFARIRDVDAQLTPERQECVVEAHPELSFALWAGRPLAHGKRTPDGRAERRALIEAAGLGAAFDAARATWPVGAVAHDDLHDAFALLWTAERIHRGTALVLPEGEAPRDARGLAMTIQA